MCLALGLVMWCLGSKAIDKHAVIRPCSMAKRQDACTTTHAAWSRKADILRMMAPAVRQTLHELLLYSALEDSIDLVL